jgi:uncharacterized phage protein (TIGR01671 family)
MREILFRGKRRIDRSWNYGDLVHCTDRLAAVSDEQGNFVNVFPETVGQYTGLTDKNGKKIFEGDVLKISRLSDGTGRYYFPPLDYPVNVIVKWDFCAWMWETLCADKRYIGFPEAWCHYVCEVIGNIHDNPELLKDGE